VVLKCRLALVFRVQVLHCAYSLSSVHVGLILLQLVACTALTDTHIIVALLLLLFFSLQLINYLAKWTK
jgi:hypothetical protein